MPLHFPGSDVVSFPTLSSLLSTAPQPGMRATALDAPGSMLYEVGGKWGGSLGSVSQALDSLTAGEWAQLAGGVTATVAQRPAILPWPERGVVAMFGTSTTMRGANTTAGVSLQSYESVIGEANNLLGSPWTVLQLGLSGATFDALVSGRAAQLFAANPVAVVLQAGGNDLDTTEKSAEALFPKVQAFIRQILSRGIAVAVQTPHYNSSNWRGALHYDTLMQEWCAYMGIPCISGTYCINAATDYIGTAKTGMMNVDGIHVNDYGCRLGYAPEWKAVLRDKTTRRILSGGSAQVASEVMRNPRMIGSVAVTEPGFSGTKPTGYTLYKSGTFGAGDIVCTVATDSDGIRYFQLMIPWGASNDFITIGDTAVSLATKTAWKFRMLADYDAITPGTMESIRTYIPFAPGTLQHPNGNASNFSGTMLTGRRTIVSPQIDTTVTGTTLNLGSGATGVRLSASASGTTVLRIYGISCRESRW